MPRRRTCPTPSVNSALAGRSLNASAPTRARSTSQCRASEKPCGTLTVVHRRYLLPRVSASVERITTCPEKGSSRNM